ncbi:MAG: sensor histidine kinase [Bryobacteraceae bacterium]
MSACFSGGKAVVAVRDQGCGVDPENLEKIFDPFFTTKPHGTGLGLSVAHQIVAQLGGVLSASRNPEGGMTFSISCPRIRRSLENPCKSTAF